MYLFSVLFISQKTYTHSCQVNLPVLIGYRSTRSVTLVKCRHKNLVVRFSLFGFTQNTNSDVLIDHLLPSWDFLAL